MCSIREDHKVDHKLDHKIDGHMMPLLFLLSLFLSVSNYHVLLRYSFFQEMVTYLVKVGFLMFYENYLCVLLLLPFVMVFLCISCKVGLRNMF